MDEVYDTPTPTVDSAQVLLSSDDSLSMSSNRIISNMESTITSIVSTVIQTMSTALTVTGTASLVPSTIPIPPPSNPDSVDQGAAIAGSLISVALFCFGVLVALVMVLKTRRKPRNEQSSRPDDSQLENAIPPTATPLFRPIMQLIELRDVCRGRRRRRHIVSIRDRASSATCSQPPHLQRTPSREMDDIVIEEINNAIEI